MTSHGGAVISVSSTTTTNGKAVARIGDMVSCPLCKGVFPISEGDSSLVIDGAPAAYNGCKTACGATLIAGQVVTTDTPSSGAGPSSSGSASSGGGGSGTTSSGNGAGFPAT